MVVDYYGSLTYDYLDYEAFKVVKRSNYVPNTFFFSQLLS